jgi:hypothetical protein
MRIVVFCIFFLTYSGVFSQKVDETPVKIRSFEKKKLEKLRENPDFDYSQEDVRAYRETDSDWEWKQWRYEQERAKNGEGFEKVRKRESIEIDTPSFSLGENSIYLASAIAIIFLTLLLLGIDPRALFRSNAKTPLDLHNEEENPATTNKSELDAKIEKAIREKNYTQAIRFCFLKTLFLLSQKKYIELQKEKTNHDYQQEVKKNIESLYDDFKYQSRVFAYIKYGGFEVSATQFDSLYPLFKNFHNKI